MVSSVGIIGFGNMGGALGEGISARFPEVRLTVMEKIQEKQETARKIGAVIADSFKEMFSAADIIIIAVKPKDLDRFCAEASSYSENCRIISVAAGKPISYFQDKLHTRQVIRFMPNLSAKVQASAVAAAVPEETDEDFRTDALALAGAVGTPYELPEYLLAAFTGLSGSGIAYVFSFIHALALGGTHAGIPYPKSLSISLDTLDGAVKLLRETGEHPAAALSRVISPSGTTIEGIKALESAGFTAAVMEAVKAGADKAQKME